MPIATSHLVVELVSLVPASPVSATQLTLELMSTDPNETRVTQICYELVIIPGVEEPPTVPSYPTCPSDFPVD